MFEKESEEAGNIKITENNQFARCARKSYKDGFKDGAEFAYNKANEWQYVSEKGTPKTEGHYLVCLRNENKDVFDCWIYYDKDVEWYSMKVRIKDIYAWKEIVPPKEIE
jgi:hypothetical protein